MKRYWWLVEYPAKAGMEPVVLVEWMSIGEADVKDRAVGAGQNRVRMVEVKELDGMAVVGGRQPVVQPVAKRGL